MTNTYTQEERELLIAAGMLQADHAKGLPQLKINGNSEEEDYNGNPIAFGSYYVQGLDEATENYKGYCAKEIQFRPVAIYNRILLRDAGDGFKQKGRTVYYKQGELAYDTQGTYAFNRPSSKKLMDLPQAEAAAIRGTMPYQMCIFGEATFPKIGKVLVEFQATKTKMSAFMDYFKVLKKERVGDASQFTIKMTLKKEKNGATVYYVPILEGDTKTKLSFLDIKDSLYKVLDTVKAHNEGVLKKHHEALGPLLPSNQVAALTNVPANIEEDELAELDEDLLDDELPY